jgi:acyl-homoserine-lactone acylase
MKSHIPTLRRLLGAVAPIIVVSASGYAQQDSLPTIRRTEFGVPHILASDFRGIGIGLGYTQVEDYGERVIFSLLRAKGAMGRTFGRDSMQSDFNAAREMQRVIETYHLLDAGTRGVYEGFAEGVNIYIRTHPEKVGPWAKPIFHGHDAAALDIGSANTNSARQLVMRQLQREAARGGAPSAELPGFDPTFAASDSQPGPDDGSNAWALAPSRTKSKRAILLRNPHLAWSAGYWEAHVTIPGVLNFYGDFRIGSAFAVIGGFNEHLGFATTNNDTDSDEVYELQADPDKPDHYLFDGISVPLRCDSITVEFTTPDGMQSETREFWTTALGALAYRDESRIFIVRDGNDAEYRGGQQFLRMMLAGSLEEWKRAVGMRARPTSNFTYADRDGNIFYIWNGSVPSLPHPSGGDSVAIPARGAADVWNSLLPLDSLPQLLNPRGGYLHNENNSPWYSNSRAVLDTANYRAYIQRPSFGLRPQLAAELLDKGKRLSLEDVVKLKHNMRMLLADRVKPELLRAVRVSRSTDSTLLAAAELLERWDNTVSAESRGGLLFESWWRRYSGQARGAVYAEQWTPAEFNSTPRGLGSPDVAVEALAWAAADVVRRFGAIDVPWGEVHRVRRGNVDAPVGGCSGTLGCFRVLSFAQQQDGKRAATSGDGWVLAVEFGKAGPRAYSVLAYGQSPDPASPHHADQAAMFARSEMKTVRFTEEDVLRATQQSYRPGERR